MTRKFTFLLMALLALAGFKSWGQESQTITIGTGTETNDDMPFNSFYNYSYAQMLYLGSEIGESGTITSISFYAQQSVSACLKLDIYMKCVDRNSYSSQNDWESVTAENLVYHNESYLATSTGWITFNLEEPFQYDKSKNLMIAFDNNTGSYFSSKQFRYTTTSGNTCIYRSVDDANVDPMSPAAGAVASWRPNIQITIEPSASCPKPTGLTASNITATGATISWNDNGAESYNLDVNGTVYENVTNPYILDVELSTTYTVKVQAVCGVDETSAWSSAINFTTPDCWDGHTINYTLNDSYGDGWNGANLTIVDKSNNNTIKTLTISSGRTESGSLTLCSGTYDFVWHKGSYDSECSFSISENEETLFTCSSASVYTNGQVVYTLDLLEKFAINLTQPEDAAVGTISADYVQAAAGTIVTLSATPAFGYEFGAWVEDYEDVEIVNNQFTMPEHDVTISATFNALTQYDINLAEVTGGTIHADYNGQTITQAPAGTVVTLVAQADANHAFVNFTLTGAELLTDNTFVMPASAVTVGAVFRELQSYTINYYVNGEIENTLQCREDQFVSIDAPVNIPAGVSFEGWGVASIDTYVTERPTLVGNYELPTQNYDLYAVLSYSEQVPVTSKDGDKWEKVTNASELKAGDEVIFVGRYNGNDYTLSQRDDQSNSYFERSNSSVTISDNTLMDLPSETIIFTLDNNNSNWSLSYYDNYYGNALLTEYYGGDYYPSTWYYGTDEWGTIQIGSSVTIYPIDNNPDYQNYNLSLVSGKFKGYLGTDYAAQIYKKESSTITNTYYMTEVLTEGEVTTATAKNIIVANPITVSGRLEMNAAGLFRNEDAANFVFADGAQFYYTGEETVEATFEKEITGYTGDNDNYYLIANPTDNDVVAYLTSNEYDLYSFDPCGDDDGYEWINEEGEEVYVKPYSNEDGSAVAVGYLYANSEDVTLEFAGVLNPAGSTDIELTYAEEGEGIVFPGFNLIGNPYACKAYVSGYSFYKMVNGELRANNARTATIAPCEGVFVEATAANQQVTVTTTAPNVGEDDINVNVTKNSRGEVIDRAVISFDGRNDMHKFMMNPANTNIRLAKNGQEYAAISCDAEGEIPVSFKAAEDDTYTITVNANNENTRYLHLIDNLTGMDVDLLANPSYTFNALTSDYAYRFKLVFSMNIDNNQSDNTNNFAFMSDGNLVINNIDGEATLQIVDVLGRVVSTEIVSGSYNKALNLKSGLYILNLNGMTQKIVVE